MKYDAVVIGAGITGLATGALLAKQGKRVVVLEKGNQPGGRAYTYEDKGFTLNYGPHAVYRPESGLLADVMRRLGMPLPRHGFPDPMRSYWVDGERYGALGAKPHQLLGTSLFSVRSRLALARFFLKLRGTKPDAIAFETTWRQWVDAATRDASVRCFAIAFATVNTYTRPAAELSARFVLSALQRNAFAKDAVGYMCGGWRVMYDTFAAALQADGADGALITGASVDRLECDASGRITAAIVGAQRYEADAFICTLPPQDAVSLAATGTRLREELAQWSGLGDVRAFCMDLGFSRRVRDDLNFVFDINDDLYYSLHSEVAPDLAPAGSQLLHAMAYLSPEEAADSALLAGRKAALIAGLDRRFAGWREALVVERTLPGVRVVSARSTPDQFGAGRVPLRSSAAANLWFAGDGRDLPLNLSEICLASAIEVADAIGRAAPMLDVPAAAARA